MKLVPTEIEDYCRAHTTPLDPIFDSLREATYAGLKAPQMQVGILEGRFLGLLVAISGAKNILEFGTFSGFSALAMASALPEDGKLITCDIDPRATDLAKEYWAKSPHGKKIELRLGPGADTVKTLSGPFDMVFIDADKAGYQTYWDLALPKVRKGGLIVVDNVLWSGAVLDPKEKSDTQICAFNDYAKADKRVEVVMLTIRDGILVARKL
ncbi:MAG: O-methyltransferase [Bdellovibrionota bacterium]